MDGRSDGWMVRRSVTCFFLMPEMDNFLYENHRGSPTLTLTNVLNILNVRNMLNVLNMSHRWPAGPCY